MRAYQHAICVFVRDNPECTFAEIAAVTKRKHMDIVESFRKLEIAGYLTATPYVSRVARRVSWTGKPLDALVETEWHRERRAQEAKRRARPPAPALASVMHSFVGGAR